MGPLVDRNPNMWTHLGEKCGLCSQCKYGSLCENDELETDGMNETVIQCRLKHPYIPPKTVDPTPTHDVGSLPILDNFLLLLYHLFEKY